MGMTVNHLVLLANGSSGSSFTPRIVICSVLAILLIVVIPILEYLFGNHLLRLRETANEKDAWMLTVFGWCLRAWVIVMLLVKLILLGWIAIVIMISLESRTPALIEGNNTAAAQYQSSIGDTETKLGTIYIAKYSKSDAFDKASDGFKQALNDSGVDCTFEEQTGSGDNGVFRTIINEFAKSDTGTIVLISDSSMDFANAEGARQVIVPANAPDYEAYQIGYEAGLNLVVSSYE